MHIEDIFNSQQYSLYEIDIHVSVFENWLFSFVGSLQKWSEPFLLLKQTRNYIELKLLKVQKRFISTTILIRLGF